MCWRCDSYDYDSFDCGNSECINCYPDSAQPEKENDTVTGPFDGMQYRTLTLGYWQDVKPGQTEFETYKGKIEFRKKPSLVATIYYDSNSAIFYSEEFLLNAIKINVQNGTEFTLEVEYK
jgi:hypothetical protein